MLKGQSREFTIKITGDNVSEKKLYFQFSDVAVKIFKEVSANNWVQIQSGALGLSVSAKYKFEAVNYQTNVVSITLKHTDPVLSDIVTIWVVPGGENLAIVPGLDYVPSGCKVSLRAFRGTDIIECHWQITAADGTHAKVDGKTQGEGYTEAKSIVLLETGDIPCSTLNGVKVYARDASVQPLPVPPVNEPANEAEDSFTTFKVELLNAAGNAMSFAQIAKWDNAYTAGGAVKNGPQPANNFIDLDSDRFIVQVTAPALNFNNAAVEIRQQCIGTLNSDKSLVDDDFNIITFTETGINTGIFRSEAQLLMSPDLPSADNPDDDFAVWSVVAGAAVADDSDEDRTHRTSIDGFVGVRWAPGSSMWATYTTPVSKRSPEDRRVLRVRVHVFNEPPGVDISGDGVINTVLGTLAAATAHVQAQIARATIAWAQAGVKVVQLGNIVFEDAPALGGVNILNNWRTDLDGDAQKIYEKYSQQGIAAVNICEVFFTADIFTPPPDPIHVRAVSYACANRPFAHGEYSFILISPGLNLRYRTLAHEIGHVLTNRPDVGNPVDWIFFPNGAAPPFDNAVNKYRRLSVIRIGDEDRDIREVIRIERRKDHLDEPGNRLLVLP